MIQVQVYLHVGLLYSWMKHVQVIIRYSDCLEENLIFTGSEAPHTVKDTIQSI